MNLHIIKIKEAINKAYLKLPPTRSQIETFKDNFNYLFKQVKDSEGEEFHKNEISEFLKKTYYSPNHYINTRGRYDLVIHNGKDSTCSVGVIIEAKSPGNISEMPTVDNLNAKSILELILYYFRERITNKNLDLKHLITTNLYEWFIFDAHEFEKHFANNKFLVQKFIDFEEGRSSGKDTSFFYNSVVAAFLNTLDSEIKFTHLDLRDFEHIVINSNQEDDNRLIPLYKIFSPEHLLKLQFKNDSNSLDKDFYRELLHIIGLEETKQGSKKLIGRAGEKTRNYGSLLENAISILKAEDLISQVPMPSAFGETQDEQLFNISLELVITWINRILFLKLLEGQLVKYNQGDKNFTFLNQTVISGYDSLNKLFFHVLAIPENERDERLKERFKNIPYLNSSLFESTDLERKTIRISNLDDENNLPIYKNTVLRDNVGKRISGEKATLAYLFEFLDAYNFSSEGVKGIQEENKTLINASVLGLIFEKINGYKDGSFFTPGFITQYMCHETISKAVTQKFNEVKSWNCDTLTDVNNKIEDKQGANRIINSLRICDPAVGSGHFLVSALNEILSIKSELRILMDRKGRVLRDYQFEVINDDLIISDPDGEPFEYNPKNQESQRVQEAIFHEKQTILESCLFGVDINPNSVKICRLRLWIELLKHAYYKTDSQNLELETLPNIDINIKCGNSLISRYPLDSDIKSALKSPKWTIDNYREAVITYRNAKNKVEKRSMEDLISKIKNDFAFEVSRTSKDVRELNKLRSDLLKMTSQQLFDYDNDEKSAWNKKLLELNSEIERYELKLESLRNNIYYKNAFEWRFEFPEILNDEGTFVGFDAIIGNPPYSSLSRNDTYNAVKTKYITYERTGDIYCLFYELGYNLLNKNAILFFITSNKWMRANYGRSLRKFFSNNVNLFLLFDFDWFQVFDNASVDTCLVGFTNIYAKSMQYAAKAESTFSYHKMNEFISINKRPVNFPESTYWNIRDTLSIKLKERLVSQGRQLKHWDFKANYGIKTGLNEAFIIDEATRSNLLEQDPKNSEIIKPFLRGRDIERYGFSFSHIWLINCHNGIKEKTIKPINLPEEYPIVYEYLLPLKSRAEARVDQGDNWYNLRNCAYLNEFENEKLIWAETMRVHKTGIRNFPRFGYDNSGKYTDKTTFIGFGPHLKYLLAFFNSQIGKWLIKEFVTKLDTGGYMMQKNFMDEIPIYVPDLSQKKCIENIVCQILEVKDNDPLSDTSSLEAEIDSLFYIFYDLEALEIQIIENE